MTKEQEYQAQKRFEKEQREERLIEALENIRVELKEIAGFLETIAVR